MADALSFVKLSLLHLPHLSLTVFFPSIASPRLSPFLSPSSSSSTTPTTSAGSLSPLIRRLRLPSLLCLLPSSSSSPHLPHPPSLYPFTTSFSPTTLSLSLYIFLLSFHLTPTTPTPPSTPLQLASAKGRFCSSLTHALSNKRCVVISLCVWQTAGLVAPRGAVEGRGGLFASALLTADPHVTHDRRGGEKWAAAA